MQVSSFHDTLFPLVLLFQPLHRPTVVSFWPLPLLTPDFCRSVSYKSGTVALFLSFPPVLPVPPCTIVHLASPFVTTRLRPQQFHSLSFFLLNLLSPVALPSLSRMREAQGWWASIGRLGVAWHAAHRWQAKAYAVVTRGGTKYAFFF